MILPLLEDGENDLDTAFISSKRITIWTIIAAIYFYDCLPMKIIGYLYL